MRRLDTCYLYVLLLVTLTTRVFRSVGASNYHDRLYHDLFANYTQDTAPLRLDGQPLIVNVSLQLVSIIGLSERHREVSASWLVQLVWRDSRLSWVAEMYDDVSTIVVPSYVVWTPDIGLFNGQGQNNALYALLDPGFRVRLHDHSHVLWFTAGIAHTSCDLDTTYFPFDEHKCAIHLESISACTDEVLVKPVWEAEGINLDEYRGNEQWLVVRTWTVEGERVCASNIKFYMQLRRKPLFFLFNIVLPITILSAMTLTVFWLPSGSGEKVGLAMTIVLSFCVFQLVVSDILPRTSDTKPLLARYVFCATLMSAVSLVTSVYLLLIVTSRNQHPPPRFLTTLTRCVACLICLSPHHLHHGDKLTAEDDSACSSPSSTSASRQNTTIERLHSQDFNINSCDAISSPASTSISMSPLPVKVKDVESSFTTSSNSKSNTNECEHYQDRGASKHPNDAAAIVAVLDSIHRDVMAEVRLLSGAVEREEHEVKVREEWMLVAEVIDRLLFWLFLACNVALLTLLFCYRPAIEN